VPPPIDLSVKENAAGWAEKLGGTVLPTGSVRLTARGQVSALPGFESGEWWVQDAAAALDEPVDGLVNNAGVSPRPGAEAAILQVNFLAQRAFTQAVLPRLRPGGAIVNMASRAGHGWQQNLDQVKRFAALRDRSQLAAFIDTEGIDATRAYNLSKEAMILWTLAITEGLFSRDLRAVSLSPGGISTGILDDFKRAFGDTMARNVQRAGRPGRPEEVAQIAAFALSREAHWLKGADIAIDGGMGAFNLSDRLDLGAFCLKEG